MHALVDIQPNDLLGKGIYGLSEAARYIGERPQRVHYWFKSRRQVHAPPLLQSDFGTINDEVLISFLDLIDAKVTGQLVDAGVSVQQVRRAYAALQEDWGIRHPFASQRLRTDGKRIYIDLGADNLAEVLSRQGFFETVMLPFLTQLAYDDSTELAAIWRPTKGVQLNPRIGFGKPVVEGTGTTTLVIHQAWLAHGGNYERVAALYELTEAQVRAAVRFQESVEKAA